MDRRKMLAVALCAAGTALGASVSVTSTQEQTVEGIGAFLLLNDVKVKDGPFWVSKPWAPQWDTIAYNLGASMMRFEIPPTFLPSDGAAYNPVGGVFGMGSTRGNWVHARALIARGCTRFIGTVWSPPCFMKYNRECPNGGVLDPAFRDKYATFIADFVKMWKDSTGVELYGLSYANEPQFVEPYNSSIWGDGELNDIITRTAPLLLARGVNPKIYAAEHMFWAGIGPYNSTSQNANLHAFAVHGYSDGISSDYGTAADWQALYTTLNSRGKKLWMTETTCDADYMTTAKNLHTAFKSGRVSAWTWWAYGDNLMVGGTDVPKDCFYATKHYARFVRPGAVMLTCTSSPSGVWATAFRNTDNTYALVLINTGSATTLDITGTGSATTFQKYESSGTNRVAHMGSVGTSGVALAGNSVTTLFSGSAISAIGYRTRTPQARVSPEELAVSAQVFTLSGRLVCTVVPSELANLRTSADLSCGTYRVVLIDAGGAIVKTASIIR